MLLVQKFLQTNTFQDLIDRHGVHASFNKTGDYFSLNYDMITSREDDLLAQECRGLILSKEDGSSFLQDAKSIGHKLNYDHICPNNTRVLAFPLKRFFNYGQGAAITNWNDPSLKIYSKLDGSLCIVWYNPFSNIWNMATRSCPEADIIMDNGLFSFRTLFEKALFETVGLSFNDYTANLDKEITYCFELTSPLNQIVVDYKEYRLTLLAARAISASSSYEEFDISEVPSYGIPKVQTHTYTSIDKLIEYVSTFNPTEQEGVVVCDSNFNRVKVKSAAYVAAHKLKDRLGASERNCMELILSEKDDDMVSFLPEVIANNLATLKAGLKQLIANYDNIYKEALRISNEEKPNDKKTFANTILSKTSKLDNKDLWTAPLFNIYGGKAASMSDFIKKNKSEGTWPNNFLDKLIELSKG